MKFPVFPLILGIALGTVHGIILWFFKSQMALASFLIYGNVNTLPFYSAIIIDVVILVTILTSGWWLDKLVSFQERYVEYRQLIADEEEEEEE